MRQELALSRESSEADSFGAPMPTAADEALFGRSVVILRRQDRLDVQALLRALEPKPPRLLLLTIGYPPTPTQHAAVEAGLRLAEDLGLRFEARLAWSMDDALDLLSLDDEVLRSVTEGSSNQAPPKMLTV